MLRECPSSCNAESFFNRLSTTAGRTWSVRAKEYNETQNKWLLCSKVINKNGNEPKLVTCSYVQQTEPCNHRHTVCSRTRPETALLGWWTYNARLCPYENVKSALTTCQRFSHLRKTCLAGCFYCERPPLRIKCGFLLMRNCSHFEKSTLLQSEVVFVVAWWPPSQAFRESSARVAREDSSIYIYIYGNVPKKGVIGNMHRRAPGKGSQDFLRNTISHF